MSLTLCQRPPSALSQVIGGQVERAKGGVEAQCLCQRPPLALYQVILAKDELLERSFEAQCLCQRLPSAFSQVILWEVERRERGVEAHSVSASACPPPSPRPFPQRPSDASVVFRRSVSASARPPPAPMSVPFEIQFNQGCRQEACYGLRQPDGSCPPQTAVFEEQHCHFAPRVHAVQLGQKPSAAAELNSWPRLHNRICFCICYGGAHRLRRPAQRNCPDRGQHRVVDLWRQLLKSGARGNAFPPRSDCFARPSAIARRALSGRGPVHRSVGLSHSGFLGGLHWFDIAACRGCMQTFD